MKPDAGLLSPDLAAGIRRVKGAKRLGVRIGNWLTVDQSKILLRESMPPSLRGKRDRAIMALLIGCGLRRAELVGLSPEDFQVREEHDDRSPHEYRKLLPVEIQPLQGKKFAASQSITRVFLPKRSG